MAITTRDGWFAAPKQRIIWNKTSARTTVAGGWFSMFELAGSPGAGTLAGTSTTTGVVPTDATAGCPTIDAFGGAATGYLGAVRGSNTLAGTRIRLFDMLWKGGAYAFNASTTGQTPTSFLSRIPGGAAINTAGQTEIWVETVTTATGNQTWNVTYNNQAGGSSSTGAVGIGAAPTVGRCWQLPLAAGDRGCSGVTGVVGGTGSAGTANILVLRPLADIYIPAIGQVDIQDILRTGMPQVYTDSALYALVNVASGTSSGTPDLAVDIVNG
jgi:hypothetical protein